MPKRVSVTGSELFIVDNSDTDWKVLRYLHDWCQIAKGIDIATIIGQRGRVASSLLRALHWICRMSSMAASSVVAMS
jgi:hypothetical protein